LAGTTFCTYTPDAKYLLTAGNNNIVRKFDVAKFDAEPVTIEHSSDGITGIATLVSFLFSLLLRPPRL
jgi:chromosome transmission fidelity protein 4